MYIHNQLQPKELAAYRAALKMSHKVRYLLQTLDGNEDELGSLSLPHDPRVLSGQRDIDTTQVPTRTLTVDALDRQKQISLHPNHPSEHGIYVNRFIRAFHGIYVPGLQRWVDTPIFTGPISKFDYDQEQTHIEGKGMEFFLVAPHFMWTVMSFRKGERITDVIKAIMGKKGVRRFDFPELDNLLPKHLSVGRQQEPWTVVQRLAHSINRHLYFDGRGVAKLRKFPHHTQWEFKDGPNGTIIGHPSLSFDHESIRNVVEVLGPKPSGKKQKRIRAVHRLPEAHPLSPESLEWNGEPRYLVESVDIEVPDPSGKKGDQKEKAKEALMHRQKYAEELAARKLKSLSRENLTVGASVLTVPDLEELDVVSLAWDGELFEAALHQSTLAFHDQAMTLGYLRRVPVVHRRRPGRGNR